MDSEEERYREARRKVRRRPRWWLRRREAKIVAHQPRPPVQELVELAAIRRELARRVGGPR